MTHSTLTLTPAMLPPLSRLALAATVRLISWEERRQTRRALTRLDAHLLRDIGLDPMTAAREAALPFWRD